MGTQWIQWMVTPSDSERYSTDVDSGVPELRANWVVSTDLALLVVWDAGAGLSGSWNRATAAARPPMGTSHRSAAPQEGIQELLEVWGRFSGVIWRSIWRQ